MDITTLSTVELKAFGFEQMNLLAQIQRNLQLVEQELVRRDKEAKATPPVIEQPVSEV